MKIAGIGAAVLAAGAATVSFLVVPGASASGPTPTSISATAPATAATGSPFTVSFAVTASSGTPLGQVLLTDQNHAQLCSVFISLAGTASCTATEGTAGTYQLTAQYMGDFRFASSSTTVAVVVSGTGGGGGGGGGGTSAPVFTAHTPPLTAVAGTIYGYPFAASGTPAPAYALAGAPSWLTIDAVTGQVSGTVPSSATGTFSYSVTATNSAGSATAGPFTVAVTTSAQQAILATRLSCPQHARGNSSGTCTVTVTNSSSGTAAGSTLSISLSSILTETSCSGGCSVNGGDLEWNLGNLAAGSVTSLTFSFSTGTPARLGTVADVEAVAATTTFDPFPYEGHARAHFLVTP